MNTIYDAYVIIDIIFGCFSKYIPDARNGVTMHMKFFGDQFDRTPT